MLKFYIIFFRLFWSDFHMSLVFAVSHNILYMVFSFKFYPFSSTNLCNRYNRLNFWKHYCRHAEIYILDSWEKCDSAFFNLTNFSFFGLKLSCIEYYPFWRDRLFLRDWRYCCKNQDRIWQLFSQTVKDTCFNVFLRHIKTFEHLNPCLCDHTVGKSQIQAY